jgi:hypothetical protein
VEIFSGFAEGECKRRTLAARDSATFAVFDFATAKESGPDAQSMRAVSLTGEKLGGWRTFFTVMLNPP